MRPTSLSLALFAAVCCGDLSARADGGAPAAPGGATIINWQSTLDEAFAVAKKEGKPIFIAINAERVDGKARLEPAGKELRENTYHDPAVVAKSQQFVCALVKPEGSSSEYAELRTHFSIDGAIVSPQHIFAHADGTLVERKEYWSFGAGQASVDALLGMMDAALAAHRAKVGMSAPSAGGTPDEQRAAWIRDRVEKIRAGASDPATRDVAVQELSRGDKNGDCVGALCALLQEPKREPATSVAILRGLGRPGLEAAVPAVAQMLDDTNDDVRSNAAVTLEYMGSAAAIDPLTKRLPKEHDEGAHNNVCRALGHCGAKQEAVRKTLLRELATAKSNKLSVGPAIGLSYFRGDADAARGIEKVLAGGVDWQKRAYCLYALTEIRDPKSAEFVQAKVVNAEKNQAALAFLTAVVAVLAGTDATGEAPRTVTRGIETALGTLGEVGATARKGRDQTEFVPNGEFEPRKGRGR